VRTAAEIKEIESIRAKSGTGFMKPATGEILYFVEGEEVSKKDFLLRSDMGHLLPEALTVKCPRCGRESVTKFLGTRCGMR
jgi:hypothetical protein